MTEAMRCGRTWSARIGVAACAAVLAVAAGTVGRTAMAQDAAAPAAAGAGPPAAALARMQRMRAAQIQARLDEAASRLQITASQEPAWQAYSSAVKSFSRPSARRGARAAVPDAAALLKRVADGAMTRAQRLEALAGATAKFQAALSPSQRAVLNEIVRMQLRRAVGMRGRMMEMRMRMRAGRFGMRGPGSGGAPRVFIFRSRGGSGPGAGGFQAPDPGGSQH